MNYRSMIAYIIACAGITYLTPAHLSMLNGCAYFMTFMAVGCLYGDACRAH